MYKIACTRKEASCILGNFFGELCPVCEQCRARPDDELALKTASGLTFEGEAVLVIEGHSSITGKPARVKFIDYGFEFIGDITEITRIRNARCFYIGTVEKLAQIKAFLEERLHLEANEKTKIFYVRQGVNAYGFKIKTTHMLVRTELKRKEKRRVKKMVEKMKKGELTKKYVVQAVNSWLGFARWACAYNFAKKIFAPYHFIKVEGALPYGAISRNRQARRVLQQRLNPATPHKAVA